MKEAREKDLTRLRMKYAIADELGLMPRVMQVGWPGLTAEETGRIGGLLARRLREARK